MLDLALKTSAVQAESPYIREYSPRGFWMDSARVFYPDSIRLQGYLKVDSVVIGGGFTGLSSAIALAERGRRVAVVEKGKVGSGASGRNCGQIGISLGLNAKSTLNYLGRERTTAYAEVLKTAILNVEKVTNRSDIDCHYQSNGNLNIAVHNAQHAGLEAKCEIFSDCNLPVTFKSRADLDKLGIPPFVTSAFHEEIGGTIHPAKYSLALGSIARGLGVEIFEDSMVTDINLGNPIRIKTPNGEVVAKEAVIATNAYSGELGLMRRSYLPLSVSVLVTERLSPDQRSRLDWRHEHGMYTQHNVIENIRLTPDGRLLIGSKQVQFGYGLRHPNPQNSKIFRALNRVLRDRFPELADLRPDIGWTGRIALSSDTIPFFTFVGGRKNIVMGGGYGGHGVALSSYAGNILAGLLCEGHAGEGQVFVRSKRMRLPSAPLRWLVTGAAKQLLKAGDNKVDRMVRRRNSMLADNLKGK